MLPFLQGRVAQRLPHLGRVFTGSFATMGGRSVMEDRHILNCNDSFVIAAVFDGHGGREVSVRLKRDLLALLLENKNMHRSPDGHLSDEAVVTGLIETLQFIDADVSAKPMLSEQGSTAAVLALNARGASYDGATFIAVNVGDSRVVLSRGGEAVALSRDHKPGLPSEKARIEAQGGSVVWTGLTNEISGDPIPGTGVYRVNKILALSRAIGSFMRRIFQILF